jgi:acetyltransferase-like isoleucine patch superfamily enzyme
MILLRRAKFKACIWLLNMIPFTRFYSLKRTLIRSAGIACGADVRIAGKLHVSHPNLQLGDNIWVGNNVQFYATREAAIVIGDNVDIAPNCVFCTGTHEIGTSAQRAGPGRSLPIQIGAGTWIGINSCVVAGAKVGSGCIVAAGAVVHQSSAPNVVLAGVPARPIRALPSSAEQDTDGAS